MVGDFAHPTAALSGGGPIAVRSGATLGGYGSVTGAVTNSGVIGPGSATPGLSGSPMGAFTINGDYAGTGGAIAVNTVLGAAGRPPTGGHQRRDGQRQHNGARDQCRWCGCGNDRNGIRVVNAVNGATTAPGAFIVRRANCEPALSTMTCSAEALAPAAPMTGSCARTSRAAVAAVAVAAGGGCCRSRHSAGDPPPDPLPPGVAFPIIGPELATYGVVQPLARQLGSRSSARSTTGSATPTSRTVAPSRLRSRRSLPTRKPGPGRPCPLFSPSVWGRFFGQTIDNHYQAFADPRASGNLGGFQGGVDLLRGSLIAGHTSARASMAPMAMSTPTSTASSPIRRRRHISSPIPDR